MKAKPTKKPGELLLQLNRWDAPLLAAAERTPFLLKQILVPIDFSDCAKKALQYAIPFARQHQAALTLLYVVPPAYSAGEYGGIDYASLEASMRESGEKALKQLAVTEVPKELTANTVVVLGSPALQIIELAKELPADIIVISTHGRTGFKHVLLGSVVEHVVRRAPCPVLVVREQEHEFLAQ